MSGRSSHKLVSRVLVRGLLERAARRFLMLVVRYLAGWATFLEAQPDGNKMLVTM